MDPALRPEDAEFRRRAIDFVAAHWPPEGRTQRWLLAQSAPADYLRLPSVQHWQQALVEQRWSVPHWPQRFGGQPFSPTQRVIWDRECTLAMTPRSAEFAIERLGPVLHEWGSPAQCEHHLSAIREFRAHWHCPSAQALYQPQVQALATGEGYVLNGTVDLPAALRRSAPNWCVIVATQPATAQPTTANDQGSAPLLLLVELTGPGIAIEPVQRANVAPNSSQYARGARVRLVDLTVEAEARLGSAQDTAAIWECLWEPARRDPTRVARNRVFLDRLRELAQGVVVGSATLWDDADFSHQLRILEIAQQGQEVLEQRLLQTDDPVVNRALEAMLALAGNESALEIQHLVRGALGYDLLPDPDPLLLANEGPIGHEYAVMAMQGMLGDGTATPGLSATQVQRYKEIIAKSALTL